MKNKNSSGTSSDQQSLGRTTEGQHLMNGKIKIRGSPPSRDLDQAEVIIEKVEEIIVKTTGSNKQEKPEAKHPHGQLRKTTLTKTTVGKKGALNQNTQKPERTIDSPILQTDLLQYDCLTSSSHPTIPSMMARPNQSSGSGFTRSRLN